MRERVPLIVLTLLLTTVLMPLLISSVTAACTSTCNFEVNTNVPAGDGTVRVRVNSLTYALPRTFAFPFNTTQDIEVLDTTINVASGGRWVFRQWVHRGTNGDIHWGSSPIMTTPNLLDDYTSTTNGPFVAEFARQFETSLSFTDPVGQPVSPPSSVTVQGPSIVTLTTYSGVWLDASVWTVTEATWQGVAGMVCGNGPSCGPPGPTIDLRAGPFYGPIRLSAYHALVKVVDSSNGPISGAALQIILYNATTISLISDSQGTADLGHIPFGSYSLNVSYQNQNYGPFTGNAATEPTKTVTLTQAGGVSPPIVSALVLLTIFGVAVFLLLLAVRVRKAAPPPSI